MDKRLISKASFEEICRILKDEKSDVYECINEVFNTALLFFPGLICKEVAFIVNVSTGIDLVGAKTVIEKSVKKIITTFSKKKHSDFSTRYEHAQIAQVLIVFAAYFDSMRLYLPDEERKIKLSPKEQIVLTEKSLAEYTNLLMNKSKEKAEQKVKDIFERDLSLPNPIESIDSYMTNLREFYDILNREFMKFFECISFIDELSEHKKDKFLAVIRKLPEKAVENYEKQYYHLAVNFNDFFVWTNIHEHKNIDRKIDIGFSKLQKQLITYLENNLDTKPYITLEQYRKKYQCYVKEAVIDTTEMDYDSSDSVVFPTKENIFVPQSFKTLMYKNDCHLEEQETWKKCNERENIGKFISDTLRHPIVGALPLLILGHPGAGKSLLCNMLAAKILFHEYHVIIIKLRDTVADQTIPQQINQQIERDFANGCTWSDIADSGLNKPVLIIFDGYDELLQASGRTYSDYLQRIVEFQKQQKDIYNIFVKCIITSRITLIDKAIIANNTPVIMLSDFDENRIKKWSQIWNDKNTDYFANYDLELFEVDNTSKVFELAKQPLLLLMLALYDSNNNALKRNKELNSTQLYDSLIREFISREKRKEIFFRSKQIKEQEMIIDDEMQKISIAALGMYNRKALYIRSMELEKDLEFILQLEHQRKEFQNSELSESDKLLGSFFFIHKSNSTDVINREKIQNAAYEFLHNTFGEFLTANYIINEIYNLLKWIQMLLQSNRQDQWTLTNQRAWVICLAYAPLFSRPVVVKMIHEWSNSFFSSKELSTDEVDQAFDFLVTAEIENIVSGESIFSLRNVIEEKENPFTRGEILNHLATYSLNLVILRTIVCRNEYSFELNKDKWQRLISLWKYAFSEDDLSSYANIFSANKHENGYSIIYNGAERIRVIYQNKIMKLFNINYAIGDEVLFAILSSLIGEGNQKKISKIIDNNNLNIQARYLWNYFLNIFTYEQYNQDKLVNILHEFGNFCWREGDIQYIFVYYLLLNYLLKAKVIIPNHQTEGLIHSSLLHGLDNREYFNLRFDDKTEMFFWIRNLVVDLLDYISVEVNDLERIFKTYSRWNFHGIYGYEYDLYLASDIYNRILRKIIAANQNNPFVLDKLNDRFFEEFIDHILYEIRDNKKTNKVLMLNHFEFFYNLLHLESYRGNKRFFNKYFDMLESNLLDKKMQITVEEKVTIIKSLYLIYSRDLLDLEHLIWICKKVIRNVNIKKVFDISQEAAENLCCLLNVCDFMDLKKLCNDLVMLIKHENENISIKFCKQIYCLAKKIECEELLVELEKLAVL